MARPLLIRSVRVAAFCAVMLVAAATQPAASGREPQARPGATALPDRLSDEAFWGLMTTISEPGGYFRITDNYTSNENEIGRLFTMLRERKLSGGVYLGVGPEQNLTYIAAIRPHMAFIIDIRRQAVMQHLMFKAMFELAKDRGEFLSLLFARERPRNIDASTPVKDLWEAFFAAPPDQALAVKTRQRVVDHLTKTNGFKLVEEEIAQLDSVITAFVQFGPGITTRGSMVGRGGGGNVTFADLTGWSFDNAGVPQSFLSTEDHFRVVKGLHDRNLIVPVSGDFGGAKALRAIADYLRPRNATVTAFYVSNVEQYLFQDGKQRAFYDNVAALPLGDHSVFIRPYALRRAAGIGALCGITGFLKTVEAGRIYTNNDALACVQ
jgi:hypothetical protein